MDKRNMYAPPLAQVADVQDTSCTREGKIVVVPLGSDLSPRCIKCNAPAKAPIKRVSVAWHSPWVYLLVFVNLLLYVIVGLVVRRTAKVSPGLCELHSAKRARGMLIFFGLGGGFCAIGGGFLGLGNTDLALVFLSSAIVLLVIGMLVSRKVYAKKITKESMRLGGCKEPFLASLEEA